MDIFIDTYLPDILHGIAQGLLGPTIVIVIALVVLCLFLIGQILVEAFTERREYKQNPSALINALNEAPYGALDGIVSGCALLRTQKAALLTVVRNMGLPEEALFSLASTQITKTQHRYVRRLAVTDTISKIGPMLGLMGTLIPLGPGIVALGNNDVTQLSQSLLVAFDATVCGLVAAVVSLIISKIRSNWYTEYAGMLESLMGCLLEKAEGARKAGEQLPCGYEGDPLAEMKAAAKAAKPASAAQPATGAAAAEVPSPVHDTATGAPFEGGR